MHVSLKSDKNGGAVCEDMCIHDIISCLILLRMRNVEAQVVEKIKTHFMFYIFFHKLFYL